MASVLYLTLFLSLSCVLWNGADATCDRLLTPAPTPRPTTRPPTVRPRPPASCPSGWTKYGNRCFLFQNAQRDWASAERACTGLRANLASVHNSADQRFLKNLVNSRKGSYVRTWVGGYDAVKEGVWLWSDGSKFTSAPWPRGEPNNLGRNEHCMEINLKGSTMYLNDEGCSRNNFYICAKRV
ncbi:galactose-specific lectin nattectin-like [Gambusia affinis]|uniref:galactose-specific lectin nattectin-like n=1 Tax=Gambusia affinis TaxID=33528 RepID=UPI001CDBD84A|nr:galactose-specific lectin nattectin-like [Gambusia affinis]